MARPLRLEYSQTLYHITTRGHAQQSFSLDDADQQRFLQLFAQDVRQRYWRSDAYCVMGHQYHLIVKTPGPAFSPETRRFHGTYTQSFNRRYRRVGRVLQGRFSSLLVEKDSVLQELTALMKDARNGRVPLST